jgi:hypothetical protein
VEMTIGLFKAEMTSYHRVMSIVEKKKMNVRVYRDANKQ